LMSFSLTHTRCSKISPVFLLSMANEICLRNVSYSNAGDFFNKQIIWALISFIVFFVFSFIDFRFLKRTEVLMTIYLFNCVILLLLFILGYVAHGSKSWFDFGFFSFQPVDMMKLVLVLILAKYFSRRHVEIRDIKHIFISGFYAFIPFIST